MTLHKLRTELSYQLFYSLSTVFSFENSLNKVLEVLCLHNYGSHLLSKQWDTYFLFWSKPTETPLGKQVLEVCGELLCIVFNLAQLCVSVIQALLNFYFLYAMQLNGSLMRVRKNVHTYLQTYTHFSGSQANVHSRPMTTVPGVLITRVHNISREGY